MNLFGKIGMPGCKEDKSSSLSRYSRQMMLQEMGEEGQQKLFQSRVLVIGAGGLGSAVLQYLVAAGVGFVRIVDDDTVSLHNLQRQTLFDESSIGLSKAECAAKKLNLLNRDVCIDVVAKRLTKANAAILLDGVDLMVDCTDNILTRRVLDETARQKGVPWIYASIGDWQGQCTILNYGEKPVYYQDLVAPSEHDADIQPPAVLGALPGVLGAIEAAEAVKFLIGVPKEQLLLNKLFWIDLKTMKSRLFLI